MRSIKNDEITGSFITGGREISYSLTRKKVKNINFRFSSDGVLKISAPFRVSDAVIMSALKKNEDAIYKVFLSLQGKKHISLEGRELKNDEKIYFNGRETRLIFDESINESVFSGDTIYIKAREDASFARRKKALENFLCENIESFLLAFSKAVYEAYFKDICPEPDYVFKNLKSRWGSCCKSKNLITYNRNLVFLPKEFAEYVVVHEFCHLLVFDHSKAFYEEVGRIMPDYKKIKDIQKEYEF